MSFGPIKVYFEGEKEPRMVMPTGYEKEDEEAFARAPKSYVIYTPVIKGWRLKPCADGSWYAYKDRLPI